LEQSLRFQKPSLSDWDILLKTIFLFFFWFWFWFSFFAIKLFSNHPSSA
jgi:type IV secretory pathway TrbL component